MGNRVAGLLAVVAGVLLLVSHATFGLGLVDLAAQVARALAPPELQPTLQATLVLLFLVASLGGLAVVLGGVMYLRDHGLAGHLFVILGAGVGLLGLLLMAAIAVVSSNVTGLLGFLLGPAGIGVVLALVARRKAKA